MKKRPLELVEYKCVSPIILILPNLLQQGVLLKFGVVVLIVPKNHATVFMFFMLQVRDD